MTKVTLYRILAVVIPVLLLELACRLGWINALTLPPPSQMAAGLWGILASGAMNAAILKTLANVLMAFAFSAVAGIALGALIHRSATARRLLEPLFSTYYAIPIYAFYPLFIVVFGLNDAPQVLIGFMLAVVSVIVATLNGLDSVPGVLAKTARVMRMGPAATALKITLPYAAPHLFTGVKLAAAYSFIGVIGAEFIMSQSGLGYEIRYAFDNLDNAVMYPLILLILVVAVALNMTLDAWDRSLRAPPGSGAVRALLEKPGAAAIALIAILLVLWQALFAFAGKDALAAPVDTIVYLAQQLGQPDFRQHIWATGQAFLYALAIAIAGGLLIGLVTGLSATAAETAEPLLLAANSIPKIALYPVVLLLFGIGLPAKVAFGAIHGVIPVAIFTMTACRGIPPVLLKTARVLRLAPADRIAAILLPAALPDIVTGIRLGFSLTLIGTILGEMFGAQSGLGYLLMTAIGLANTQVIMAVTLLLVVIAATVSSVLLAWERALKVRRTSQ